MTIQGEVAACAGNQSGFKIGETWHNIIPGEAFPKRGDIVSFEQQLGTDGKTYVQGLQVTGSAPAKAPYSGPRRGGGAKTPHDKLGPIIGHNLLIAATILGPGTSVADLVAKAKEITQESEKLVNAYVASKATPVAVVAAAPVAAAPVAAAPVAAVAPAPAPVAPAPAAPVAAVAGSDDIPW